MNHLLIESQSFGSLANQMPDDLLGDHTPMMKATIESAAEGTILQVEGKISGPWVEELERLWRNLASTDASRKISVDLKDVTFIDEAGKNLLLRMAHSGAIIHSNGCMTSAIVNSILGSEDLTTKAAKNKRFRRRGLLVLIPLLFFVSSHAALAQENPVLKLNLHQAVQVALKQNPEVQIATLNLAESRQDSTIARAALLPQADFNLSDRAVRANLRASLGFSIPGFPEHAGPFQVFQTGSDFSSPVFDLSLLRQWQASRKSIESSDAQRLSVREQVVLLVVSQYLTSLRAGAEVQAAQSRVDLAQALYDQSADMEKHGVATGVDTLRANVELQNEKQRLIVAQTDQKIALYGLAKLLNIDPEQEIELVDQTTFFQTPQMDEVVDLAQVYEARPEMKAFVAEQESLRYQEKGASESRLPSLRFDGNYEQMGLSSNTVIPTYVYQASVSLPLFTGGRIHAEVARDNLEVKKLSQRITDERNQIALDVRTAKAELNSARNQVKVANLGVQLAQEVVRQARDRFQAGVADNIEVISAQDALARANDNQIAALYQYNESRANLARAVGGIESFYTK